MRAYLYLPKHLSTDISLCFPAGCLCACQAPELNALLPAEKRIKNFLPSQRQQQQPSSPYLSSEFVRRETCPYASLLYQSVLDLHAQRQREEENVDVDDFSLSLFLFFFPYEGCSSLSSFLSRSRRARFSGMSRHLSSCIKLRELVYSWK